MTLESMEIYKVGGAVRDKLLGYPVVETDWVIVGATPEILLAKGYTQVGKDFPVFLHPTTREECALARTERKSGHGYHGFVVHADPSVTLEEDLARRDLTINAMALSADGVLTDPFNGRDDLAKKLLRHVSAHFIEDPLRVLRVARFAARYAHLGFQVADETLALMQDIVSQGELAHLSVERIWVETDRALSERDPHIYFSILASCGALKALMPEIDADKAILQLERARRYTDRCDCRWAAFLASANTAQATQVNQQLKVPKLPTTLALAIIKFSPVADTDDPKNLLELVIGLDGLRKDEPFTGFCITMPALADYDTASHPAALRLIDARKAAMQISAADVADTHLKGPALGAAISARRQLAIASALTSSDGDNSSQ